jgi:OPA family glycerol-3-phosphate transporter-like MFS transporter
MVHWFSTKERGLTVSVWNAAHNVGGALVANLALVGVWIFHDWGAKFYFNALIAAAVAVVVFFLLRDTPQSCGLPPVEDYRNDYPSLCRVLARLVVACARAWIDIPGFLTLFPLHMFFKESSVAWSLYEYAAIPGTIACGWISDKIFKGRRAPATVLFMALTLLAVLVYWFNLRGPLWIDYAALIAIGFLIYGPIMIIGLHALDLVPKKAAGTAAGFTGFFGYVFGSAIAGTGVGWIADRWNWNGVFVAMVSCCVLTIFFSALTLAHKAESEVRTDTQD